MSGATIANAANTPLNVRQGSLPDVSGAIKDYFQQLTFKLLTKSVVGFEAVETANPINFWGTWQPIKNGLELKPEGQRAWKWFLLHAEPSCTLNPDDVVIWNGVQTRVMSRRDYALYGYVEYELAQDWTGSGPNP
jgi:hypothetical protein